MLSHLLNISSGLAMTCVTRIDGTVNLRQEAFDFQEIEKAVAEPINAFAIISHMLTDDELAPGTASRIPPINARFFEKDAGFPASAILGSKGGLIMRYANSWRIDTKDLTSLNEALGELLSSFGRYVYWYLGKAMDMS